eukprot:gene3250-biopygen5290
MAFGIPLNKKMGKMLADDDDQLPGADAELDALQREHVLPAPAEAEVRPPDGDGVAARRRLAAPHALRHVRAEEEGGDAVEGDHDVDQPRHHLRHHVERHPHRVQRRERREHARRRELLARVVRGQDDDHQDQHRLRGHERRQRVLDPERPAEEAHLACSQVAYVVAEPRLPHHAHRNRLQVCHAIIASLHSRSLTVLHDLHRLQHLVHGVHPRVADAALAGAPGGEHLPHLLVKGDAERHHHDAQHARPADEVEEDGEAEHYRDRRRPDRVEHRRGLKELVRIRLGGAPILSPGGGSRTTCSGAAGARPEAGLASDTAG